VCGKKLLLSSDYETAIGETAIDRSWIFGPSPQPEARADPSSPSCWLGKTTTPNTATTKIYNTLIIVLININAGSYGQVVFQ
jgi:hypothetical protein